jgi:hypothetical protein
MCRVVTCVPPWLLDDTCTSADAVDQGTASHNRPCLETPTGTIDIVSRPDPHQLRVAGWAVDGETNSPVDVHVYVDGAFVTAATANQPRGDFGAVAPLYGPNHGYDVTVPIDRGATNVCVYAINLGVPGPNPLLGCRPVPNAAFGALDVVQRIDPSHVRVQGWAIDPGSANPIDIHVVIDGTVIATESADGARPDVAQAYPAYGPSHGFDTTVAIPAGADSVCVTASVSGQGDTRLGCRPISHDPFGNFEELRHFDGDHLRVMGWVIDPDVAGPIDVHVYADNRFVLAATADKQRADVGAAFPGHGANHGFDVTIPVAAGRVCVYAINAAAGAGKHNPLLSCRQVDSNPFGGLDLVDRVDSNTVRVAGWAIDPDRTAPIDVHVYLDGRFVTARTASASRADVGGLYPAYGPDHGYDFNITAPTGARSVCVYGINVDRGASNPLLGCRAIS